MQLRLLEPIRELCKDEVCQVGLELGLPIDMVYRHLFPGSESTPRQLASLKTLYELRELRFKETSGKGAKAEQQVMQALADIQLAAKYENDEIVDLSTQRGRLPGNKTGDVLVAIDGKDDCSIDFEIKPDKGVKLGLLDSRDPAAQADTAIGWLLEMRATRETDANVIVFDENRVDSTVAATCVGGAKFIQSVGFIVIVGTRRGDFSNLVLVYSIYRELATAKFREERSIVMIWHCSLSV